MKSLGQHINFGNNFFSRIRNINSLPVQTFICNDKGNVLNIDSDVLEKVSGIIQNNNIALFIHSSYKYNISLPFTKYSVHILSLLQEIYYSIKMGAIGIVIHFGKNKLSGESLNNMYRSIFYLYKKIKKYNFYIILETSSGQGSELCYTIEDLYSFFSLMCNKNMQMLDRIKLCIDTCHIYVAGYDIKKSFAKYINKFDKLIGIQNVILVHLNDSKHKCGSKIDRHEIIGKGYIGYDALKRIYNFCIKHNIYCLTEQ